MVLEDLPHLDGNYGAAVFRDAYPLVFRENCHHHQTACLNR